MTLALSVPVGSSVFRDLLQAKVPMIQKTFPVLETSVQVTITKPDQFYRANGKVVSRNFARHLASAAAKKSA